MKCGFYSTDQSFVDSYMGSKNHHVLNRADGKTLNYSCLGGSFLFHVSFWAPYILHKGNNEKKNDWNLVKNKSQVQRDNAG